MRTTFLLACFMATVGLVACQSATPTPMPTPAEQVETSVAATIYANQTSTAAAEEAVIMTLTALAPTATDTPAITATPTATVVNFILYASSGWSNTGVVVHTGETVTIRAAGEVNTWGGREGSSGGPDGQQKSVCGAIECPLQGANYGALIGRVENGKPFLVGANLTFTATADGQLYLTVNDWTCNDNSGTFVVFVKVQP